MRKQLMSYLLLYSLTFGIICPAPLMAMSKTQKSTSSFVSFKSFKDGLAKYGTIAQNDARFLYKWAKQKYNQMRNSGTPTTTQEDARAKNILITKGIPVAIVMTLIITGTIYAGIKGVSYFKKRAEDKKRATELEKKRNEVDLLELERIKKLTKGQVGKELMFAIGGYDKNKVKTILKARSDLNINTSPDKGITPLILASTLGQVDVVKMILEKSPNLKATSSIGTAEEATDKVINHIQVWLNNEANKNKPKYYRKLHEEQLKNYKEIKELFSK